MNIVESTRFYEAWLADQTDLQRKRLATKHEQMAVGPFPFLRATFYRWIQQWRKECRQLDEREEDVLVAVGDLHLENFGTWRDSRERVVWGVLHYDEASRMPFTNDLVRLATSIALAKDDPRLDTIAASLLAGYRDCLSRGGAPVLVTETERPALLAAGNTPDELPEHFSAQKLQAEGNLAIKPKELPRGLEEIFRSGFARGAKLRYFRQRRPEELGSLGRRRYLAVTASHAGQVIVREAKALVPSPIHWLEMRATAPSLTATLLQRAVRSPDPSLQVHDRWLIRQLAPEAIRLPVSFHRENLFLSTGGPIHAMGFESANIHLGSKSPAELGTALDRLVGELGADWLEAATERMVRATREDQLIWEKHWRRANRSAKRGVSTAAKVRQLKN